MKIRRHMGASCRKEDMGKKTSRVIGKKINDPYHQMIKTFPPSTTAELVNGGERMLLGRPFKN